jgi:hypothetical protein
MEPGAPGFGESTAALDQVARSKVAMRRTHLGRSGFRLRLGFALGPVTTSSGHAPIGNLNLSFGVVSHGMGLGCGISISGDGLFDLITIRLSHRGIGQRQSNRNGN